ncbi:MAG: hypothetical protein ABSC20_03440 [Candidatus Bathyarchaeia archaeon]|jgi:DMSO/TMAO reductase YedYZ molybdopterin-dependent catalytic subunit
MNAKSEAKSKFNKKLLAIPLIILVIVAVVVSWQIYWQSSNVTKSNVTLPALNLTLVGANGQQKVLNSRELAALKSYTANGGYSEGGMTCNVCGTIYLGNYTGVPILTLLDLVGGITSSEKVNVTGSDGYQVTFTYQQVHGQGLTTFDPTTGATVQASQPLKMIVAYYCNGTSLASGQGPLSVAFVGPQGLVTPGNYWAYLVVKIEIFKA